jgi:small-conductance mechanosensitive channel
MRFRQLRQQFLLVILIFLFCLASTSISGLTLPFNAPTLRTVMPVLAQTAEIEPVKPTVTSTPGETSAISPATVVLDGESLFTLQAKLGPTSPRERVKYIEEKLSRIAKDETITLDDIKAFNFPEFKNVKLIYAHDIWLMTVTEADAKAANRSVEFLTQDYLQKIRLAIKYYRDSRTQKSIIEGIIKAIIATIFLSFLLYVLNRFLPFVVEKVFNRLHPYFQGVDSRIFFFLPQQKLAKVITYGLNITRIFFILFLFYLYIPFVLSCFPLTKGMGIILLNYFWGAVDFLWDGFVAYLPNLFIVVLTIVCAFYTIRFSNFFFKTVQQGTLHIPGFYAEWAKPTANLVNFLIIGLSAVLIFPYLPASTSKSFQGVSIFIGALFTFGSTSIIGNVVSGIVLIYTRAFQLEDIIQVNGQRGKVVEKGMLSTRIMTPDNEVVTIPNASLLVSDITNFSAIIRDRQQPLLLKTTVTLGYDLPWRKVHETLIQAAKATTGIVSEPEPFVLQTSLDDFYVSYTLKAFTVEPDQMPLIYSALHQNIQDYCNEADIEIMSPHYSNLRDGNLSTIPANYLPDDYQAPGFKLDFPSKS